MNDNSQDNLKARLGFFEKEYKNLLSLRREDETRISIVFQLLADSLFSKEDEEGLLALSKLFDASFSDATGDFYAVGEYILSLRSELQKGEHVDSRGWLKENIDDEELYESVYKKISDNLSKGA